MLRAEIEGAIVVVNGSFNPPIFQPRWLGVQGLIRPEEAENAKITIIQTEVADFSTDWFQLQVLQNRFLVSTSDPRQYGPLRDLAVSAFSILPHTPVTGLVINRHFHFKMKSKDEWNTLGHILAPKEPWNGIMEQPGLLEVFMQGSRKPHSGGILRIKVQPSVRVDFGVYVEVGEEFKASPEEATGDAPWVPAQLAQQWDSLMTFAMDAAIKIVELVKR
jgi:hypothetical protein